MTLQEFQSSIARTYRTNNPACHGLGIAGEAGEVADIIKKVLFHTSGVIDLLTSGRRDDMRLELGDVLWYIAAVASDWGFTLDEVAQANIVKLAERYPNGFVKSPAEPSSPLTSIEKAKGFTNRETTTPDFPNRGNMLRIPRNTFRAIQRAFALGNAHRSVTTDLPVYNGRQTLAVCATLFEEGDE